MRGSGRKQRCRRCPGADGTKQEPLWTWPGDVRLRVGHPGGWGVTYSLRGAASEFNLEEMPDLPQTSDALCKRNGAKAVETGRPKRWDRGHRTASVSSERGVPQSPWARGSDASEVCRVTAASVSRSKHVCSGEARLGQAGVRRVHASLAAETFEVAPKKMLFKWDHK